MILYPTETVYGLGVNVFDEAQKAKLFALKGRAAERNVSWLVRDIADINRYSEMTDVVHALAEAFLPGPLTLVLPARPEVAARLGAESVTLGFRISADVHAQTLIAEFMDMHDAPLTCTSANVSGQDPALTPNMIMQQFKDHAQPYEYIERIVDDGPRSGVSSTVVLVEGDSFTIIREGSISHSDIVAVVR